MAAALERLLALGEVYVDPVSVVVWEQADAQRPWLPAHLLSIQGLSRQERLKLSRIDFARLATARMWLDGLLIHCISTGGFVRTDFATTKVALQQVRDEAGQGLLMLRLLEKAELAGIEVLGQSRLLSRLARRLNPDGSEFWAVVFLCQSSLDALVARTLREDDGICPMARQILELQHRDQARHVSAARVLLEKRLAGAGWLRRRLMALRLGRLSVRFLDAVLSPTPASLAALGFANPENLAAGHRAPGHEALAAACAAPALLALRRMGVPVKMPAAPPTA